ncbi:hypothetical protein B0H66DRAFT_564724 [Apodospora peruviana]|uniref:AAA+ ATPase domain-containing protein n=1 Tax=Apodospora peruviana TaxID=516989 RepID=A0AAE0M125_9PEZI|nr:hypothetical protein B0H66DRAFT_564724 [Apodospora peruviana]
MRYPGSAWPGSTSPHAAARSSWKIRLTHGHTPSTRRLGARWDSNVSRLATAKFQHPHSEPAVNGCLLTTSQLDTSILGFRSATRTNESPATAVTTSRSMPPPGARALLSAKCSCQHHLPRLVVTAGRATATSFAQQHNNTQVCRHVPGIRSFRTSSAALTRSDESNPAATEEDKTPETPDGKGINQTSPEHAPSSTGAAAAATSPPDAVQKEIITTPRSQSSYRSRVRAARARAEEADSTPPVEVPGWFVDENVSLYESRPIGAPHTVLEPLSEEDREALLVFLDARFSKVALLPDQVGSAKDILENAPDRFHQENFEWKLQAAHQAALLQALALVHSESSHPDHVARLRGHYASKEDSLPRVPWWNDPLLLAAFPSGRDGVQRWLSNLRGAPVSSSSSADEKKAVVPVGGVLHASPLAKRPDAEYPVCMELLAAVRSELSAEKPRGKRNSVQRPVTVLSVLNGRSPSVANSVVDDIATDLGADVVHLSAASIASLVGKYMGQNMHWNRGAISMLGYGAAEMNGRLASRAGSAADQDSESGGGGFLGMVTFALPSPLRSMLRRSKNGGSSVSDILDGRWEELKMVHALESLINAVEIKRGVEGLSQSRRDLIVHVHDYVEMSALQSGIISKLRAIVDSMWQKGIKVVLVGSSATSVKKSAQMAEQLAEMGQDGQHHVIPFYAADETLGSFEDRDNFLENVNNIKNMLQARLRAPATIDLDRMVKFDDDGSVLDDNGQAVDPCNPHEGSSRLYGLLAQHVYDAQWVYRLTSVMLGGPTPRFNVFDEDLLTYAVDFISDRNNHWKTIYPRLKGPYYSPLSARHGSSSSSSMPSMSSFMSGSDDWSSSSPGGGSGGNQGGATAAGKELDQHEKKLLSGLINAKDIHTTFNDIIVPQETKESLIGLTSLSLLRPDAFSYGVLKTERIPGCLLYGPPGTGKTLLAKAVAKESGANMLEVSAASINEMWMGQSEKNVRALFSLARKMAPMVIFLDEADALLGARHNSPGGRSGHRETITQFLREWDGLSDMRAFIMVATNRPFDLDEAVLRRLPRKILVDLPLANEREQILGVMLREEELGQDVDLAQLAKETDLYSGSDLKNLCVSAAMEAVRDECRTRDAFNSLQEARPADEPREEYQFPAKRVLTRAHFEKGLREISASISEDMDSLKAIRKFDTQYGDAGRKKRGRKAAMGFEVVEERRGTEEARVRQVIPGVVEPVPS